MTNPAPFEINRCIPHASSRNRHESRERVNASLPWLPEPFQT
jgi:hypothetical protein